MRRHRKPIAGTIGRLTPDEERELVARTRPPHSPGVMAEAMDRLGRVFLRLAEAVAATYLRRNPACRADHDDLVGAGVEAMMRSVSRYDPSSPTAPSAYAYTAARNAMLDTGVAAASPVHVPMGSLRGVFRKKPTLSPKAVGFVLESLRPPQNMTDKGEEILPHVEADDPTPEIEDADEARHLVSIAMAGLPPRERRIIAGRFGLGGKDPKTWKAAGRDGGVCESRAQIIAKRSMGAMRETLLRVAG